MYFEVGQSNLLFVDQSVQCNVYSSTFSEYLSFQSLDIHIAFCDANQTHAALSSGLKGFWFLNYNNHADKNVQHLYSPVLLLIEVLIIWLCL